MDVGAKGTVEITRAEARRAEGGSVPWALYEGMSGLAKSAVEFVQGWWDAGMNGGR